MTARKLVRIRRRKAARPVLHVLTKTPLNAVIIAIDSAKRSGCATYERGRLVHYAEVRARDPHARLRYLQGALERASRLRDVTCALVLEVPYGGTLATAISLSETVTLWRDTWATLLQPPRHVVEKLASEWRRELFGRGDMTREQARHLEAITAARIAAQDIDMSVVPVVPIGGDAAAAICLGFTCVRSPLLREALGCELLS
jgi:hypothetical protein